MNYFKNRDEARELAKQHTIEMSKRYPSQIKECIENSVILEQRNEPMLPYFPTTDLSKVVLWPMSTQQCLLEACVTEYKRRAVLNFASFKNPGGMFIDGSTAQEESLCHSSCLYNVLSEFQDSFYTPNKTMLNHSMYANRGIYSPDVVFEYEMNFGDGPVYKWLPADVFTIAAPNAGAARRSGIPEETITATLKRRIHFVIQSMLEKGPYDIVILGAFGCGVFRNHPRTVARLFYQELDNPECKEKFGLVTFAIIGDNNFHIFEEVLENHRRDYTSEAFGLPEQKVIY